MYRLPLHNRVGEVVAHALVDPDLYDRLNEWRWSMTTNGYVHRCARVGGRKGRQVCFYLHRVVMRAPEGVEVDHRDGNRLDNRRSNLRLSTHAQNQQNLAPTAGNTSRYRGVCWDRARQTWRATVQLDGRTNNLGYFEDEQAARRAAAEFRAQHMTHSDREHR